MKVEVVMPEEYLGDIMGDITSRRGRVEGMEARGNAQVVSASVPLSENVRICKLLYVLQLKDVVLTQWYSTTTKKYLNQFLKKLSKKIKDNKNYSL